MRGAPYLTLGDSLMDLKALLIKNAEIDARIESEKEQARVAALEAQLEAAKPKPKPRRKAKAATQEAVDNGE